MAPEKTKALPVTDRRSFQYPKIVLRKHEIKWKKSIKFLDVQLDRWLSFGEHLPIATAKAIQWRKSHPYSYWRRKEKRTFSLIRSSPA